MVWKRNLRVEPMSDASENGWSAPDPFVPRAMDSEDDPPSLIPFLADREEADRLAVRESWRMPSSRKVDAHIDPFTLPWFLQIERRRYARHGAWIPRLLEFSKHHGEKLLALGDGLGTDWVRYAEHGTEVIVCSPSNEQLLMVQRHFELRAVRGEFMEGEATSLPVNSHGMDLVCLSERDWTKDDLSQTIQEIYRVLKPGGKVMAIFPAWYNAAHWQRRLMPWQRWFGTPTPPVTERRFTSKELHSLFTSFSEVRIHKRHLRRGELPHLWRVLPLPILERFMGRYLIVKAFKPLSSVASMTVAA